jgi:hypothetical protein
MFKGKVLLFSLLLVFATSAFAGDVDECESTCNLNAGCTSGMRLSICPQGDFEFIRDACGGSADYIEVWVRDGSGVGIAGVPTTDYWMDACDPGQALCICAAPFGADGLTDPTGYTTISNTQVAGGGCILTGGVWLSVQGKVLLGAPCVTPICLNIQVVSPDRNADCVVNLSDLGLFGLTYNVYPPTDMCCDFNDDGYCNLSDFAFMGAHYQHTCF